MLILNRRVGESIIIGDDDEITITILDASKGRTRVGITAHRDTPVNREELLYQQRQRALKEEELH